MRGIPASDRTAAERTAGTLARFRVHGALYERGPDSSSCSRHWWAHATHSHSGASGQNTSQRQGPPYRILPPPKAPVWACRVEDPDNLIGAAARASTGSVHSLPLMIKEPESLKSKDPDNRWCEVRAGIQRWVADAGPLPTPTLTTCQRIVVNCAQNLS